jgi:hypothetical protein
MSTWKTLLIAAPIAASLLATNNAQAGWGGHGGGGHGGGGHGGERGHLIAVGTPITGRPPHRTVRAEFPHTAPTLGV